MRYNQIGIAKRACWAMPRTSAKIMVLIVHDQESSPKAFQRFTFAAICVFDHAEKQIDSTCLAQAVHELKRRCQTEFGDHQSDCLLVCKGKCGERSTSSPDDAAGSAEMTAA